MIIYAIFLCLQATNQCQPVEAGHYSLGDWVPPTYYKTLEDCDRTIQNVYGRQAFRQDKDRYFIQDGMWYECLSRHVDTWEQPQE